MKGGGCLLWADPIPDCFELVGAGDAGHLGDVAFGETHHPFGECRVQAGIALRVRLRGGWGGAGQSLPSSNSGGVGPEVNPRTVSINWRVCPTLLLGCWPPPVASLAVGVGK